jgi:two-component system response regulator YesN
MMIHVLIVDDDKLARKGLISIMPWMTHDMEVVGEAANGVKALEFLEEHPVELMFVDLAMPGMSGIELIKESCRLFPNLRFVVLTFHEDFEYIQTALRLGALDYISKARMEKFEKEDYDLVFDHIQKSFENDLKHYTNKSVKSTVKNEIIANGENADSGNNEEKWSRAEKDWRELYWLFNDVEFKRICQHTVNIGLPVDRIKRMFVHAISQIEGTLHITVETWPIADDEQSAIEWVKNYRDQIYKYASETTNISETSICVLKTVINIRDQIAMPLHAGLVASQVNLSRSYYCQLFKKMVGLTFNDFLRQERISIAKSLLCQSKKSIGQIAQAVGYEDVKYFSHIFREQTNFLPSEFRIQFSNLDNLAM